MNEQGAPKRPIIAPPPLPERSYGPSRWANPRRYACAHPGCSVAAKTSVPAGVHQVVVGGNTRTHNCCGNHNQHPTPDDTTPREHS